MRLAAAALAVLLNGLFELRDYALELFDDDLLLLLPTLCLFGVRGARGVYAGAGALLRCLAVVFFLGRNKYRYSSVLCGFFFSEETNTVTACSHE